jgi:hypothetical protein
MFSRAKVLLAGLAPADFAKFGRHAGDIDYHDCKHVYFCIHINAFPVTACSTSV